MTDPFEVLRTLDRPVDPDPAFAGALLDILRTELDLPSGSPHRPVERRGQGSSPAVGIAADRARPPTRLFAPARAAAAAFVLVVLLGTVAWWLSADPATEPTDEVTIITTTTTTPPPDRAEVTADTIVLPTGMHPIHLAFDGDRYWILTTAGVVADGDLPAETATLVAVDAGTGEISARVDLTGRPTLVVTGAGGVWVAHHGSSEVTRIDPNGAVKARIDLALPFDFGTGDDGRAFLPNDVAVGFDAVWVTTARGAVARIDPASNTVAAMIPLTPAAPERLAIGEDSVWVAEDFAGLTRVDPASNATSTVPLPAPGYAAGHVAEVDGFLYVSGHSRAPDDATAAVSVLDAVTLEVVGSTVVDAPVAILGWVNGFFGALDPATGSFRHLGAVPQLVTQVSRTNWDDRTIPVALGRETWMLDHRGSRLERVRDVGPWPEGAIDVEPLIESGDAPGAAPVADDWQAVTAGPMDGRTATIVEWTGSEIVVFGGVEGAVADGAAFDPATDRWRPVPAPPLQSSTRVEWVWTGTELVVWNASREAAAWLPSTGTWRTIEEWPLPGRSSTLLRPVYGWTGHEIVDAWAGSAVDPATGAVREIAEPPHLPERATVVTLDGRLVVLPAEGVYDPATDAWAAMSSSRLNPVWIAGAAVGGRVVAVDYEMHAAAYDPAANAWSAYPDVPIRFLECGSEVHVLVDRPVAQLCGTIALWVPDGGHWLPIPLPYGEGAVVTADGAGLFVWSDRLYHLESEEPGGTRRVAAGTSAVDVPPGWTVTGVSAGIRIDLTDGADRCRLNAINADAAVVLAPYLAAGDLVERERSVGGPPRRMIEVEAGRLDDAHHLVWATGTSDVVDVACSSRESARLVADATFSRYAVTGG